MPRSKSVPPDVRDSLWLYLALEGMRPDEIARSAGVSVRTIQAGIREAIDREARRDRARAERLPRRLPLLIPLFPVDPFTPLSACPHHGPIEPGSDLCCMVCNRSGMDAHPALRRDPATDPIPLRHADLAEPSARPPRRQRRLGKRPRRTDRHDRHDATSGPPAAARDEVA